MPIDRRSLMRLGMASGAAALAASIRRAAAIDAHNATGTIDDIEHVVVLMQENRSFDHYLGTLRGVRGFADPHAARLPDGGTVFAQRDALGREILPFRPEGADLGLTFLEDLPHDWQSTHRAWNDGRYDGWVPQKGTTTMAHLTRGDIPFHYALADAFTVCDAWHCSVLSSTDPNRYYMWSGWVGNDGAGGGPVVDNAEAGYAWRTFPERLQNAGIDWRIYQDVGAGLTAANHWGDGADPYIGTYGDNTLLYFRQFQQAAPGSALHDRALTGTDIASGGTLFDRFAADIAAGRLPAVSWLVAPEAYSEHPNWPPNYGAWYIARVLDALTADPKVWSRTALIVTYDENDGFFDHMVPPTPAFSADEGGSTVPVDNERFPGSAHYAAGPYGLGVRVPAFVVSPWSRGGYVNSQLFDHTSIIRFLERRFGPHHPGLLHETNITPWRRAVAGDLTSAFDFATPNRAVPRLPDTAGYAPPDRKRHPDVVPAPPAQGRLPQQEAGLRRARALPYALDVQATPGPDGLGLRFVNGGSAAAVFQLRAEDGSAPRSYTVSPGAQIETRWTGAAGTLRIHGPNGLLREFTCAPDDTTVAVSAAPHRDGRLALRLHNHARRGIALRITDLRDGRDLLVRELGAGATLDLPIDTAPRCGWYDLEIGRIGAAAAFARLAGHVETGADSIADPALGGVGDRELGAALRRLA